MLISVCIPVYKGEQFLWRCLESLAAQTFRDFEIIVVDDCSPGLDEKGWNCKKICKVFSRKYKQKINYFRNSRNMGCIDARRNAVYEAKGKFIFCLDVDDVLKPECLEVLAKTQEEKNADIVQCGAEVVFAKDADSEHSEADVNNKNNMERKANLLFEGELLGKEVFDFSVINHKINFFVWGKLVLRQVFLDAFEKIPPCYCVWGEDYLIYFFVTYFAKKYVGIKDKLYVYSVDTGISSGQKIEDLTRWEKVCSVSSVFSIIFDSIENENLELSDGQKDAVRRQCNTYVLSTYRYFKYFCIEEIKPQAWEMFCDYWGKSYVEKILIASGEKENL